MAIPCIFKKLDQEQRKALMNQFHEKILEIQSDLKLTKPERAKAVQSIRQKIYKLRRYIQQDDLKSIPDQEAGDI